MSNRLRILFSPLNWGLGHATRMVPIIRQAANDGHEILLAANAPADALWRRYFPDSTWIPQLPPYLFHFPNHRQWLLSMVLQLPRLAQAVRAEHAWLNTAVKQYGITHVVSDNRYGLWHPSCTNILITHQPYPLAGTVWHQAGIAVAKKMMRHFDAIWIPDYPGEKNLSGALSHRGTGDSRFRYIGPLSALDHKNIYHKKDQTLVLLSGPEPWRSRLLHESLAELQHDHQPIIVAGAAATPPLNALPSHVQFHSLLMGEELGQCIQESSKIIARSGYSTIMDLHLLRAHEVIWKPTPGQLEQEYLLHWIRKNDFIETEPMSIPGFF